MEEVQHKDFDDGENRRNVLRWLLFLPAGVGGGIVGGLLAGLLGFVGGWLLRISEEGAYWDMWFLISAFWWGFLTFAIGAHVGPQRSRVVQVCMGIAVLVVAGLMVEAGLRQKTVIDLVAAGVVLVGGAIAYTKVRSAMRTS